MYLYPSLLLADSLPECVIACQGSHHDQYPTFPPPGKGGKPAGVEPGARPPPFLAMALEETFAAAAATVSKRLNKTLTDQELKEVYGLYKQATLGDVSIEKPGMLDLKYVTRSLLNLQFFLKHHSAGGALSGMLGRRWRGCQGKRPCRGRPYYTIP